MKIISNRDSVNGYLEKYNNNKIFNEIGNVCITEYEKGEFIQSPSTQNDLFQIVALGTIEIYLIRDDGTRYSLSYGSQGYILGDMDLFCEREDSIFVEAITDVICMAVPLDSEKKLKKNVDFMCFVAESLANKIRLLTKLDATPTTLEERVLSYIKYKCDDGVMKGIEHTSFQLHCSARHLQRIMNKYLENGIVEKIGKGSYKII